MCGANVAVRACTSACVVLSLVKSKVRWPCTRTWPCRRTTQRAAVALECPGLLAMQQLVSAQFPVLCTCHFGDSMYTSETI